MDNQTPKTKEFAIESVISTAIQIPGVKVNRKSFLAESFAAQADDIQRILDEGPVNAGISRKQLETMASKLIFKRTGASSIASFISGIPGGFAMAATIPADILQFFGMSLRLAQELSYLYGAGDLWVSDNLDEERVKNQLLLYCGVMFGASGAVSGVRILTSQLVKATLKKLPQKALTKTVWYPIVKQIGKALAIKVTKSTVAKSISKAIPVVGGVVSGTINFASMMPMANRLQKVLDDASFDYSEEEMEEDLKVIEEADNWTEPEEGDSIKTKISGGFKKTASGVSGWISKRKEGKNQPEAVAAVSVDETMDTIKKLKGLLDAEIITQEEFDSKKAELLSKI